MTDTNSKAQVTASKAKRQIELWFFRDMSDEQRLKLFSLFGMPVEEIKTHGTQRQVLRHLLAALAAQEKPEPGVAVAWQPKYKPQFVDYLRRIRGIVEEPQVFFSTRKEAEDYGHGGHDARPLYAHPASVSSHPDDLAVDRFAAVMKAKLAKKRAEGRGGWENPNGCSIYFLSKLLRDHVSKGDPVDVGNLAMMIHQRGGRIE